MITMFKSLAVLGIMGAAVALTGQRARADHVSIGFGVSVVSPRPVYYAPAPVYYAPAPVYYAPTPVYAAPEPVYVSPSPVYVTPAPVYYAPQRGVSVSW